MNGTQNDPSTNAAKPLILVVDDNQEAANTMALLLKLTGNEVHVRYDRQAGVEAAGQLRPSVIIMDISMPGMDGYQACRASREQPWGKTMKLIALSGYGQADDRQRSNQAGFDVHLVKPVDPLALQQLIDPQAQTAP